MGCRPAASGVGEGDARDQEIHENQCEPLDEGQSGRYLVLETDENVRLVESAQQPTLQQSLTVWASLCTIRDARRNRRALHLTSLRTTGSDGELVKT
jgi:hypothetical protein